MAFHTPFNQRRKQHSPQPFAPVYIGFEVPAPPRRHKFNWWGFNGMWMSFASLLTAGFLSPVPLLVSLRGLGRPGKKMATIGTLTSLGGIGIATMIVLGALSSHQHQVHARQHAHRNRTVQKQVKKTQALLAVAIEELTEYRDNNRGELPEDLDANMLVIKHVDPWGESLRFDEESDHGVVRSAGPDRAFDTRDDVTENISGKTHRTHLLPIKT